jgi:hypothetical protein
MKEAIYIPHEQWPLASVYLERNLLDKNLDRVVKGKPTLFVPNKKTRPTALSVQVLPKKRVSPPVGEESLTVL